MTPHLQARGVSKLFGQVRALNEIDLEIGPGVTGLLGPNGSGKSTLLKLFAGQLLPDAGQVRLMGADPFRQTSCLRALGLCPEQDAFYEDQTGHRFIEVLTRLHGFDKREAKARTVKAIERVGMSAFAGKKLKAMSRGMRQRIKIAQAIAHDPPVVLLDEPLTGADPVARADLIALVHTLGAEGRCVLVSSHVLHEVEAMTDRVIFIRFGRLRAHGEILPLRTRLANEPFRLVLQVDNPREIAARGLALAHVLGARIGDGLVEFETSDLSRTAGELVKMIQEAGMSLHGFHSPDADLQSLYRYLMEAQQ